MARPTGRLFEALQVSPDSGVPKRFLTIRCETRLNESSPLNGAEMQRSLSLGKAKRLCVSRLLAVACNEKRNNSFSLASDGVR